MSSRSPLTDLATSPTISSATPFISVTVSSETVPPVANVPETSRNASRIAVLARCFVASFTTSSGSMPSDSPSSIHTQVMPARCNDCL